MALLKDSGTHKAENQFFAAVHLGCGAEGVFPSVAAVGDKVRDFYGFLPPGHIRTHFIGFRDMGHGAGSVFGEENLRSPAVHVLFQGFQEIFFWCQHFDSSNSAYLILL